MVSRWRTWGGHSHVDSIASDSENERKISSFNKFELVNHTLSWAEFHEQYRKSLINLSQYIKNFISEELRKVPIDERRFELQGMGRAELLRSKWYNKTCRKPGPPHTLESNDFYMMNELHGSPCLSSEPPRWPFDDHTLCIRRIPPQLKIEELKGIVESFGIVSNYELITSPKGTTTCYLRMKDSSTCGWVISYFQGRPYDDDSEPIECGFATDFPVPVDQRKVL